MRDTQYRRRRKLFASPWPLPHLAAIENVSALRYVRDQLQATGPYAFVGL